MQLHRLQTAASSLDSSTAATADRRGLGVRIALLGLLVILGVLAGLSSGWMVSRAFFSDVEVPLLSGFESSNCFGTDSGGNPCPDERTRLLIPDDGSSAIVLHADGDAIDEDGVATLNGFFFVVGPDHDLTLDVDWGEGPIETFIFPAGTEYVDLTHQYLDGNPPPPPFDIYTVNATVTDTVGNTDSDTAAIVVDNLPPLVAMTGVGIDPAGNASVEVTFTDVGTQDTHDAEIDWGDGVDTLLGVTSPFTAAHVYATAGSYTVTATVIDDDSGSGEATIVLTSVTERADLAVTKIADKTGVEEGEAVTYTATVTNLGPDDATGVEITDLLPSGVTFRHHRRWRAHSPTAQRAGHREPLAPRRRVVGVREGHRAHPGESGPRPVDRRRPPGQAAGAHGFRQRAESRQGAAEAAPSGR